MTEVLMLVLFFMAATCQTNKKPRRVNRRMRSSRYARR